MLYKLVHKNNPNNSSPHIATSSSRRRRRRPSIAPSSSRAPNLALSRSTPNIEPVTHGGFASLNAIATKAPNLVYPSIWVNLLFSLTLGEDPIIITTIRLSPPSIFFYFLFIFFLFILHGTDLLLLLSPAEGRVVFICF